MENEVENSKRYYVIMLLCYYVIMLLQRRSSPSTILFNNTMQLSMYMRLTTNATILKALPRPFADNIYHFRRLSKKFPRLLSSTSKKTGGKRRDSKENAQLCGVVWLHRQAKTCPAAVAKAVKTTIRPTFRAIGSRFRESHEILQNKI